MESVDEPIEVRTTVSMSDVEIPPAEKVVPVDPSIPNAALEKMMATIDLPRGAQEKLAHILDQERKSRSIDKDFQKDMESVRKNLESQGYFDESRFVRKGSVQQLKEWGARNPDKILEIADNGKRRLFERVSSYDDPGQPFVMKKRIPLSEAVDGLETAEDDRVLGIPYAQAMAGDRLYVINGKVFTGWGLYFSLSAIKSPEDYPKNIDLVYNVSYLYAAILLKAQLGLGCGFDVNYGSEDQEVVEERLIRKYLFKTLNINTQKLVKTGFHLGVYGNSYWALRRDKKGLVDKITILQPERLKIFLDPMTTKILFYIYLPPIIGGTTIASYPDDGRYNPNILTGVTLSYPTPIVMHPEDVCHFKINDFTEYPFGFSDVKFCIDPATARLDINILAPIIFKKYTKPMIHWSLNTYEPTQLSPQAVADKRTEMLGMLENMEPGSDPVTTDRWTATVIDVNAGKNDIFTLANDMDTQVFAATGAPETYFKPKGSTDRMISEQDKTFISRLKIPQMIVAEQIEEKLIKPRIDYEINLGKAVDQLTGDTDEIEELLKAQDSYLAKDPKYPEVVWNEIFKQDETQAIADAIALLNAGIITPARASVRVGEKPLVEQQVEDMDRQSISNVPLDRPIDPTTPAGGPLQAVAPGTPHRDVTGPMPGTVPAPKNPGAVSLKTRQDMEGLRGGLNVAGKKDESNRNVNDVKDPNYQGGSRYEKAKLVSKA